MHDQRKLNSQIRLDICMYTAVPVLGINSKLTKWHMCRDEIQRSRALDRLVKTVTAGLPRDKVIVGFGAAGAGWHKSCISRR